MKKLIPFLVFSALISAHAINFDLGGGGGGGVSSWNDITDVSLAPSQIDAVDAAADGEIPSKAAGVDQWEWVPASGSGDICSLASTAWQAAQTCSA